MQHRMHHSLRRCLNTRKTIKVADHLIPITYCIFIGLRYCLHVMCDCLCMCVWFLPDYQTPFGSNTKIRQTNREWESERTRNNGEGRGRHAKTGCHTCGCSSYLAFKCLKQIPQTMCCACQKVHEIWIEIKMIIATNKITVIISYCLVQQIHE